MVFHLEEPAESVLHQVWNLLFLPQGIRQSWEQRFPDLRLAA